MWRPSTANGRDRHPTLEGPSGRIHAVSLGAFVGLASAFVGFFAFAVFFAAGAPAAASFAGAGFFAAFFGRAPFIPPRSTRARISSIARSSVSVAGSTPLGKVGVGLATDTSGLSY